MRLIAAGAEARKMVVEYTQADGAVHTYGHLMPDGPLGTATGRLLRGWHNKCYHVVRKREARGDAVTGRVLLGAAVPTGYDITGLVEVDGTGTGYLAESLEALREVARSVGKPVGDPTVTEAYRARQAGGPYPHTHRLPLGTYHLLAHLRHAHGFPFDPSAGTAVTLHERLHARQAGEAVAARRAADAAADDAPDDADGAHGRTDETDWRRHVVLDVQDVNTP